MYLVNDVFVRFENKLAFCKNKVGAELLINDELLSQAEVYGADKLLMLYKPFPGIEDVFTDKVENFVLQEVLTPSLEHLYKFVKARVLSFDKDTMPYYYVTLCVSEDDEMLKDREFRSKIESIVLLYKMSGVYLMLVVDSFKVFSKVIDLFDCVYCTESTSEESEVISSKFNGVTFNPDEPKFTLIDEYHRATECYLSTDTEERIKALAQDNYFVGLNNKDDEFLYSSFNLKEKMYPIFQSVTAVLVVGKCSKNITKEIQNRSKANGE